VQSCSTKT